MNTCIILSPEVATLLHNAACDWFDRHFTPAYSDALPRRSWSVAGRYYITEGNDEDGDDPTRFDLVYLGEGQNGEDYRIYVATIHVLDPQRAVEWISSLVAKLNHNGVDLS